MSRPGPWRPPAETGTDGVGAAPVGAGPGGPHGPQPVPPGGGHQNAPPPPKNEPAAPPPEEIHTAWVLWLAAAGLAMIGMLLNAFTASFVDLPVTTRDAFRDAIDSAGNPAIKVEDMFSVAMALGAVFAVIAAAVTVWLAFRLRAGRGWARTMLDIVAIFLVVDGVSVLIGVFSGVSVAGERGDVVSFIVFSLQILAGLCAATAVWRQHTAEAMKYTSPNGGARAGE